MQIVIQNYGVNESDVPSLNEQLIFLPETAKFYGLDSRMQLSEKIALFKKLDTINPINDGLFQGCSRMGRAKRPPLPKICLQ